MSVIKLTDIRKHSKPLKVCAPSNDEKDENKSSLFLKINTFENGSITKRGDRGRGSNSL